MKKKLNIKFFLNISPRNLHAKFQLPIVRPVVSAVCCLSVSNASVLYILIMELNTYMHT